MPNLGVKIKCRKVQSAERYESTFPVGARDERVWLRSLLSKEKDVSEFSKNAGKRSFLLAELFVLEKIFFFAQKNFSLLHKYFSRTNKFP